MAYVVIQQHKFGRMYLRLVEALGCYGLREPLRCDENFKPKMKPGWRVITPRPAARSLPTAGRSIGRSSSYRPGSRAATRMPNKECRVHAARGASGSLLTAVVW